MRSRRSTRGSIENDKADGALTSNRFFIPRSSLAAKQCRSRFLAEIRTPSSLSQTLQREAASRKFFLSELGGRPLREVLGLDPAGRGGDSILILVGPEGGWTEAKDATLRDEGCEAVSLGDRILRAETAALCAVSAVTLLWNR